jgi:methionyl-tRNA formyltransferase
MNEAARIAFAGTPAFAVPSLMRLIDSGARIERVLTQPDRPAGRGRALHASPVKQAAVQHGIEVQQPERLDAAARLALADDRPDLLVVVAYGLILPQWMLDWPSIAAVNVHASLLPRWRGAAPIQHAILAGDAETGVSLMRMTRGLDAGPVYGQAATPIGPAETAGELHDRLAELGADLIVGMLPAILAGSAAATPQPATGSSYAPKIDKHDAPLDFGQPARVLERRVRGFNPWPVAEALYGDGRRLRVWQAVALDAEVDAAPGTVIAATQTGIDVATGQGVLRLTSIQPPGGRAMSAAAYLAAHSLAGVAFAGAR